MNEESSKAQAAVRHLIASVYPREDTIGGAASGTSGLIRRANGGEGVVGVALKFQETGRDPRGSNFGKGTMRLLEFQNTDKI